MPGKFSINLPPHLPPSGIPVSYTHLDPKEVGVTEQVYYPVLAGIIEESAGDVEEMKSMIRRDLHDLIPKHIPKEDILASINYNMHLEYMSLIHI